RSSSRNGHHSRTASSLATRHSTPANVEDLAALLYEMRENQDEHYRKTDDRLAHLEGDHNVPLHQTVQAVSTCSRTTQTWGASTVARRRRGRVSTGADNDSESCAGQFDLDAEDVIVARGKLSVAGREVQGGLEENLSQVLRLSARMTQRVTREVYLTSDFGTTVNDEHNRVIFNKVAHSVWEDLNTYYHDRKIRVS
ncbi:hypothetical protein M405DRAFT_892263, partial [Rhizopogon salebrosus TDB-379]